MPRRALRYTARMPQPAASAVCEIAVNLDDVSPEVLGHAHAALLDDGALDVWTTAIHMKKQRPGVCLSLLCATEDRDRLARRVIELTGSFGVRCRAWDRLVLERRTQQADTPFGPVRIKLGRLDGKPVTAKPEFDDVAALAARHGVALRTVLAEAQAAAHALLDAGGRA